MTVRNNKGKIIQFKYGDDNINPTKTENQKLPLTRMSLEEIYSHFQIPEDDNAKSIFTTTYTLKARKRLKKQKNKLASIVGNTIQYMLEKRDELLKRVFNHEDNIVIHIPVNFHRIMNNIQHNLNITPNFMIDITPLEVYELLNHYYKLSVFSQLKSGFSRPKCP